jgi:hypothetical protein
MESQESVNEGVEVELPESESAPVHRLVRQFSEAGKDTKPQIPTEPGLYWASCLANDQYDAVLLVYGEAPFLKTKVVELPIVTKCGIPVQGIGIDPVRAVGPCVVIPGLDDK